LISVVSLASTNSFSKKDNNVIPTAVDDSSPVSSGINTGTAIGGNAFVKVFGGTGLPLSPDPDFSLAGRWRQLAPALGASSADPA
jgi:hypothetical protein